MADNRTDFEKIQDYTHQFLIVIFGNPDYRPTLQPYRKNPEKFHQHPPKHNIGHAWNSGLPVKRSAETVNIYYALSLIATYHGEVMHYHIPEGKQYPYEYDFVAEPGLGKCMSASDNRMLAYNLHHALQSCKEYFAMLDKLK